jgi:signal transduction histidine kinase
VTTDLAGGLPLIEGRRGALNQVWLNIIVNASQAVAERHRDTKGAIAVTTRTVDGGQAVEVSVQDDGAGIPPDHLERIFDPFFTTKEIGKGTGQGLAIAHQTIVTEHNGRLDVESTAGQGTRFVITLPVAQPAS